MRRIFRALIPVLLSLAALQLFGQNPVPGSKILNSLTREQIDALQARLSSARQEMNSSRRKFDVEASWVLHPGNTIALVRVTDFKYPDANAQTLLYLHVEQVLRGHATKTELTAETCWVPPPLDGSSHGVYVFHICVNLAHTKPEIGAEYLIGYRTLQPETQRVAISGALVMDDSEQAAYLPDVQRFINIESEAGDTDLAPFIVALDDSVPWIQNVAEDRLRSSTECRLAPGCLSAITAAAANRFTSKNAATRMRALSWVSGLSQHAETIQLDPMIRQLLIVAANDPNEAIAEDAFSDLARLNFLATAKPGDCIEIVPALRRTAQWSAAEAKSGPIGGPLWGVECIPEPPSPAQP